MHAIINQGNGKYYVSAVFGFYRDITATDDFERYIQSIHNTYWIVWDSEKRRLIKWLNNAPSDKYIITQIIIVDSEQDNWIKNDSGEGCVDFLSKELLDSFLDKENQPEDILDKCRKMDSDYKYNDTRDIKTQKDIEDLYQASGGFHDAYISHEELLEDGTLYIIIDDTWACKFEIWFSGDLEYNISRRDLEEDDPYWYDSTILLQDGFVYLIDDSDMTVEEITPGLCYFKARNMKYRIIPDFKI